MRIREKEEIRQRQSVLVDLACDGIFHDQQLWQRQHRKRKQFYLSWWVHLHGEQGRNGKLPLGRSCWRRFAALWLAPEDYGKNNGYDDKNYDDSHHNVNRTKFLSELQGSGVVLKREDPHVQGQRYHGGQTWWSLWPRRWRLPSAFEISWGPVCQDTADCSNSNERIFKCIASTRYSTAPVAVDTWQTWNPQTEDKKLVEYWHVRLGSGYSEGKTKLSNADQNPHEKWGNHQRCQCCRGQHALYRFQVRVLTYPCPLFICSNLKLKVQRGENPWIRS